MRRQWSLLLNEYCTDPGVNSRHTRDISFNVDFNYNRYFIPSIYTPHIKVLTRHAHHYRRLPNRPLPAPFALEFLFLIFKLRKFICAYAFGLMVRTGGSFSLLRWHPLL